VDGLLLAKRDRNPPARAPVGTLNANFGRSFDVVNAAVAVLGVRVVVEVNHFSGVHGSCNPLSFVRIPEGD